MTPEIELEVAKAIRDIEDPLESASEFRACVQAAVAKLGQLGYAIVPKEPTDKMLQAQFGKAGPRECYIAMIEAANL